MVETEHDMILVARTMMAMIVTMTFMTAMVIRMLLSIQWIRKDSMGSIDSIDALM